MLLGNGLKQKMNRVNSSSETEKTREDEQIYSDQKVFTFSEIICLTMLVHHDLQRPRHRKHGA